MKNKFIIFFIIIISFCIILTLNYFNNNFEVRININIKNTMAFEIDNRISQALKDSLLAIQDIKDIYIFSKKDNCNIYCKINPFCLNKQKVIEKIQRRVNNSMADFPYKAIVTIDDEYDKKYDYFLVVFDDDYINLKNKADAVVDDLLNSKAVSKILNTGERKRCAYINYSPNTLLQYNISIENIKNLIKQNNIYQNSSFRNENKNSFLFQSNSFIKNIEDIKKIAFFYKNKEFSTTFDNIFLIEDTVDKNPGYLIFLDNKKAQVIAISKRKFVPFFILKNKLKNYENSILIKTSSFDKITMVQDNNSRIDFDNIKNIYDEIQKTNIKNCLFFIGLDVPKTQYGDDFFEIDKGKINIFLNKKYKSKMTNILKNKGIKYVENKNNQKIAEEISLDKINEKLQQEKNIFANFFIYKEMTINYDIDNFSLNDYLLDKKEVIDAINCQNEGMKAGYYFIKDSKIPILIKNKDEGEIFVYSKYFKTLLSIKNFTKENVQYEYSSIARKNGNFYIKYYTN